MIDDKRIEFKQKGCSYSISENKYQEFLALKPWRPSKKIILPKRCGCGFHASSVDRPSLHPDYVIGTCARCGGVRVQRIELPDMENAVEDNIQAVTREPVPDEPASIPPDVDTEIKPKKRNRAPEIILAQGI